MDTPGTHSKFKTQHSKFLTFRHSKIRAHEDVRAYINLPFSKLSFAPLRRRPEPRRLPPFAPLGQLRVRDARSIVGPDHV